MFLLCFLQVYFAIRPLCRAPSCVKAHFIIVRITRAAARRRSSDDSIPAS